MDGVLLNLKEKLILGRKVEGTRPLKALSPVIWGGHMGFEKLVYIWTDAIWSVCVTNAPLIHMKNSEGNGKRTRWLIYVRIYVYTYICVKRFSGFRLPVTFDLRLQTRSGFETEPGKQGKNQKNQRVEGLQGVKFKFVIPHVQVYIKLLQLSCQQDRFRAGQVPPAV